MRQLTREETVQEFHDAMKQTVDGVWTPSLLELRARLISEEFNEFHDEFINILVKLEDGKRPSKFDRASLLKELADLQYVISGCAVALGLPLQEAFIRVHNSNMSKFGDSGEPIYREDGKVIKGPNYQPPILIDLI